MGRDSATWEPTADRGTGPPKWVSCVTRHGGGHRKPALNEYVEPLGMRVLIRKDESRHKTRGGIVLPDQAEIPTITGRVVEVSIQVERDADFPIEKYDKVLFHPKNSIPVDFEQNNLLYVVPIEDVVAVFRRHDEPRPRRRGQTGPEAGPPEPEAG